MNIKYINIFLALALASTSALATDGDLVKQHIKKKVEKKANEKIEYSRSLQDVINASIKKRSKEAEEAPAEDSSGEASPMEIYKIKDNAGIDEKPVATDSSGEDSEISVDEDAGSSKDSSHELKSVIIDDAPKPSVKTELPNQIEKEVPEKTVKEIKKESGQEVKKAEKVIKEEAKKPENKEIAKTAKSAAKEEVSAALDQATIEADDLTYDPATKTLTAENNVVMGYRDREIRAQKIEYDQDSRMISAENGVQYKDSSGTIFKADDILVTDKFDKGEMKNVNVDFGDGSTFTSENLTILDMNKYNLSNSVYSPCDMCKDGKHLWQMDAQKIFYNEADGRVYYRNAYLKLLGKKIAWLPYLSHPTPYAKSASGFLTPKFGQSSEYGFFARIPYYYQPKQNLDFTFSPLLTMGDGPIMVAEMRHLIESGSYELEVSGATPPEMDEFGNKISGGGRKFRGHFKGKGDFTSGEYWNYGFDIARSSDDTYLRRYNLGNYEDVLKSELYVNRLKDRDYFSTKAISFQGLRATDDPAISPYVAPLIDAGKTFAVSDKYNGRVETNLNTMVLKRDTGADSSRLIGGANYKADYTSSGGHMFNFSVGTRADYYDVNKVPFNGTEYNGSVNRVMPNASVTWSYPLQKMGESYSMIIEPITMAVISPNGNNTAKIPNEDSQNIDLSDYNLFQENHISGYDIVEDGFRLNYGVRGVVSSDDLGDYNFLLGQNYRAKTDPATFDEASGLSDNYSDYVGRIVTGSKKVQSSYRFRLDKDNMKFKRNEVGFNIDLNPVQLATNYTFIDGVDALSKDRQEIASSGTIKINDSYSVTSHATRNMDNDDNNGWVNAGTGLIYTNKCLTSSFEINKEFTRDRDIRPATEFIIKIALKNFGS